MTEHKPCVFTFDDIEVREREFCIVKNGQVLAIEPKAFRVLLCLIRNPRQLVSKDELLDAVWNDCSVSENSLTQCVARLRRALGDDTHEPRYIATVPTLGYRFLPEVQVAEDCHLSVSLFRMATLRNPASQRPRDRPGNVCLDLWSFPPNN